MSDIISTANAAETASSAVPPLSKLATFSTTIPTEVSSSFITVYGINVNYMAVLLGIVLLGIFFLFYRIQKSDKLDFADLITKDGSAVSLTKVLQLLGGLTATWIMIKLTITGGLTEALFGLYLTYVGAIEGYSKFVAAKYNYNEKSVKTPAPPKDEM